jgi:anaerobic selenocysteine-containing dehydrogenase
MGLGKYFWEDDRQALDFLLKPAGITFDDFRNIGVISGSKQYRSYEKGGFKTPSGKVELYSSRLKEWGFDPLPVYHEPPESPLSEPNLAKEYPLVFTNWKLAPYKHTGWRQVKSVRKTHPDPLVVINTDTAKKLGIKEGNWVYIETKRGKIRQKATLSPTIDPRVVISEHGWWFPERKKAEMFDWAESNLNILTDDKKPFAREMGSATLRGILCKVSKAS